MGAKFVRYAILSLVVAAAAGAAVSAGADGRYLAIWDNQVRTEAGVVRTFGPLEYAAASPSGAAFAVLSFKDGSLPPVSAVRVYGRGGELRWAAERTAATGVLVADSGAAVLVAMRGPDPKSPAQVLFYSSAGVKTGEAAGTILLGAAFFPGEDRVALTFAGDATRVYDLASGAEEYNLPAAAAVVAGPDDAVLLVDDEWTALYRRGAKEWEADHGLYFPRHVKIDAAGEYAVLGAHHEVATAALADGRIINTWEAPAGFAVTDLAAAPDFSSFAVGVRSLDGTEAAVWLDGALKVVAREEHKVAQPSGSSPVVAVLAGARPAVVALGQGWHATLAK